MLDTAVMFDRVVRANAADEEQAERIVQNRFFRNMAVALSGTQEYMASEALHQLHADPRFDVVVVDTPPSRHALHFLEAPGVLARFLEHKVFRLLMLPTRSGLRVLNTAAQPILRAIGRVVGSDVLADAVAFFQAFAGMEVGFRERASSVMGLLAAPDTRYVLVASPRHDTVEEAVWFADQLGAREIEVAAAIVNRLHPRFGSGTAADAADRAAAATDPRVAALWENLAELRTIADREREAVAPLAGRIGRAPIVEVPLLAGDVHDLDGLAEIGAHLFTRAAGRRSAAASGRR
jgi:anion-transporting  ArsA/GET3 family ATPase